MGRKQQVGHSIFILTDPLFDKKERDSVIHWSFAPLLISTSEFEFAGVCFSID